MCGIVGFNGAFSRQSLEKSVFNLRHRGPDDSGIYVNTSQNIGLGHTRLSILDISDLGHQPMISVQGDVVIAFNGEIYNFQFLRQRLKQKGYKFISKTDTEVLIYLYIEHGDKMIEMLNGIFAIAIYDKKLESILIARDAFGVKPLYYATSHQGFVFSSEIKAIKSLINFSESDLDYDSIYKYINFLWCPGEGTPLKNVKKILPGSAMWIKDSKITKYWEWYSLPYRSKERKNLTQKEWIEGTQYKLQNAVKSQMISDVPVGAFLSGGLDSSSIAAFASKTDPNLNCFTIELIGGQEDGTQDDLPYAKKVSKHLGIPLNVISVDSVSMANNFSDMIAALDEPLADPAALNVLYISKLARDQGIKVLLSGTGGDDLFTGYRRHMALKLEPIIQKVPTLIRKGVNHMSSFLDQENHLLRKISNLARFPDLSGDAKLASYFVWGDEQRTLNLFNATLLEDISLNDKTKPFTDFLQRYPDNLSNLEKMLLLEQRFFLSDHNLSYTDKMSMNQGVETRVPFLDLELVNFASQIPLELKQKGTQGKWILKKAMESILPKDIIYRSKTGFGAPIRSWIKKEMSELISDVLSSSSLQTRSIFDHVQIHKLIKDNDAGKVDASYTILAVLSIEIWCQKFFKSN